MINDHYHARLGASTDSISKGSVHSSHNLAPHQFQSLSGCCYFKLPSKSICCCLSNKGPLTLPLLSARSGVCKTIPSLGIRMTNTQPALNSSGPGLWWRPWFMWRGRPLIKEYLQAWEETPDSGLPPRSQYQLEANFYYRSCSEHLVF